MRQKFFAGTQIRRLRENQSLTQASLAERLAISASYLNQIENNQRPVTAPVLLALAQAFSIDLAEFAQEDTEHLLNDLKEALADPLFASVVPNSQDLKSISANMPWFAHAFLSLHLSYRRLNERAQLINEAVSTGRVGLEEEPAVLLPYEEVRDFFHYRTNYFDGLDRAAEARAEEIIVGHEAPGARLADYLFHKHAVRVEIERVEPTARFMRRFDRVGRVLWLREGLSPATRTFLIAYQIGFLEQAEEIESIVSGAAFRSASAATITRIGLANYFAAALLMPYGRFLAAARRMRYDAERLANLFATSFEQVGHRFSTLQRPNDRGVPFYFVRIDRAGNIIKRHSSTRFPFARLGGTCPLWNVHQAFEIGDRTLTQIAETPDGIRYICVARQANKAINSYVAPPRHYALGIGCEIAYAQDVVYADGLDLRNGPATPIGVNCRLCDRGDCLQRAAPPIDRTLIVDPERRDFVPFRFK